MPLQGRKGSGQHVCPDTDTDRSDQSFSAEEDAEELEDEDEDGDEDDLLPPPSTAKPQLINGQPFWAEHWGLTRQQVQELLWRLQREPHWHPQNNVYTLVDDFVIPWTRGTGLGYALLLNEREPREVNVMISHAFAEEAEGFLEAVLRSTTERDVVYICALSNYQAEDGSGPSIAEQLGDDPRESPFRRVLEHIALRGRAFGWRWHVYPVFTRLLTLLLFTMLVPAVPMMDAAARGRSSPLSLHSVAPCVACAWLLAAVLYWWVQSWPRACAGRMVVVPNWQMDIYGRLWCVYEMFISRRLGLRTMMAPSLIPAGRISSSQAACSKPEDAEQITREIVSSKISFRDIDASVKCIACAVTMNMILDLLKYVLLTNLPFVVLLPLYGKNIWTYFFGVAQCWYLGSFATVMVLAYVWARSSKGVLHVSLFVLVLWSWVLPAWILFQHFAVSHPHYVATHPWLRAVEACLVTMSAFVVVALASLARPFPVIYEQRHRLKTLFTVFLTRIVISLGFEIVARGCNDPLGLLPLVAYLAFDMVSPIYMIWTESLRLGVKTISDERYPCMCQVLVWLGTVIWFIRLANAETWAYALRGDWLGEQLH